MTEQKEFKEQGGIATMDPSRLRRWVISKLMTRLGDESIMLKKRAKAEKVRKKNSAPHVIEYFHQVDDGYSHLAAQSLAKLSTRYDIELHCHLVTGPQGHNVAEPELLNNIGLVDAKAIAPYHSLDFPDTDSLPSAGAVQLAQQIITSATNERRVSLLAEVSSAVWRKDETELSRLAEEHGSAKQSEAEQLIRDSNERRAELKHYSGAMFYYASEWYWGVDRLYHLEERLRALGAEKTPEKQNLFPRKSIDISCVNDPQSLTLEIYASLRSPYTAIAFDRAVKLAKDAGIQYQIRPVLPMVMRGVPATKEKGFYIMFDTAREARAANVPYGSISDPIGEPARNGYKLYFWAEQFNKGTELFSNFLKAAFAEGVNTNKPSGLQYVVEKTGLNWDEARQQLTSDNWQAKLENNRLTMYDSGIWGVPSFRLLNSEGKELLATWGQDRLWLIANEIKKHLGVPQ